MNILRKCILCALMAATVLGSVPAQAGDRWRNRDWDNRGTSGDRVAAGVAGLALGALIVGAIAANRDQPIDGNPYRRPRPAPDRDFMADDMAQSVDDGYDYRPAMKPWSRSWYRYCADRYRSFDPDSGTYIARNGREYFCTAG